MTSMKDCLQVEVTGDADADTSELYVENTIENPALYTVEDNHVSLVSENVEKCIELETNMMDDGTWETRIKKSKKDVTNQSNMELPLEYQDFTDNTYLNPGNTNDIIFHCYICGKSFVYNYLLKNHLAEHKKQINYKTNECTFCGKQFKLKFALNRHIQKRHNSMCATIVPTAPHANIPNNDIISYPGQTKVISNTLERNSSDQIEQQLVMSDLFPEPVPLDSKIIAMEREQLFKKIVRKHFQQKKNIQQSNVLRHNAISNNNSPAINSKQEINFRTTLRKTNSSDQMDSVNSNESTLAKEPHDLMVEQFPINTANNNIVSIVRDTPYFCIRKLPNIENEFCNDDYDQTSLNNLIFTCKICKNSSSTDIHSFALHMSDHGECNMPECIVCDKTFNSIVLWTSHMTYHQEHIDLNVSTVQFNLLESESNTFNTNNENIKLEPNLIQNGISIKDNNTDSVSILTRSRNQKKKPKKLTSIDCNESINKNNDPNSINKSNKKKSTYCVYCDKHFAYTGALTNHMRIHALPCDVCEKKFSTPLQLKAHRNRSHPEIVPYVCKICNKSYRLKYQWNSHLKSHYKKEDSNLKIKQHTNNLKSNISKLKIDSISHEDKIKCRYCKKECNSMSQWKDHMSTSKECHRHGKSYLPEFTSNKTALDKKYLNTHDNTGSHKDKLMDIIQQKPVIKHTEKHTEIHNLNIYKCKVCGNQCETNLALSNHMWENHSDT